jgi:DNA polymerase III alpha subunit
MITKDGFMLVEEQDIIELMLANRQVKILPSNKTAFGTFAKQCKTYGLDLPFSLAEEKDVMQWNMPDEFKVLDLEKFIQSQYPSLTSVQWNRVQMELTEFEKRGLNDLLRFLCYFVSVLRTNNIIYGVGRGSSIASYVLFLIGVHRIDSFKFNLDIKEFLK